MCTHPHIYTHPRRRKIWTRLIRDVKEKMIKKKARRDFMQILTPTLSGNQQQPSSSPKNCRPVVTRARRRERERERERNSS